MQFEHYFPLGLAKGEAFLARAEETEWLEKNIQAGIHTLITAPRRYGKSSLILHTLEHSSESFIEIDFQLCRTAISVEKKIISGIELLITKLVAKKEKILTTAKKFFKKSNKQWKIGLKGFLELSIEPEKYDDVTDNLILAFNFLEAILAAENKRVVIFIDEIQEITELEEAYEIQAAIRHFAQKTQRVTFIFSGSNRRLLQYMFDDSKMPLYQLCDNLTLCKISAEVYEKYISKVAKKTLNQKFGSDIIKQILNLTKRHPRRVYNLCLYFWRGLNSKKKTANIKDVNEAWDKLLLSQLKAVRFYLSKLNTSQLRVLSYIALESCNTLTSKQAQQRTNLSSTAISKAVQQLEDKDLIEHNAAGEYNIVDPVIESIIKKYERDLLA